MRENKYLNCVGRIRLSATRISSRSRLPIQGSNGIARPGTPYDDDFICFTISLDKPRASSEHANYRKKKIYPGIVELKLVNNQVLPLAQKRGNLIFL
ncbi:hypothetical protein [Mesorhizobium sp. 1B3]|uniref:hypothetical protein n=1 Tax=Mesorhizobium sp. 1B3 TaxID=3243599 RepID=UPI003D970C1F